MASSGHRVMSTLGFHNADVSKFWLLFNVTGFLVMLIVAPLRAYLTCSVETIFNWRTAWKVLLLNLWPNASEELICTCILIYVFRNVERKMGSKKFANFLLTTWLLSAIVEVAAIRCYAALKTLPFVTLAISPYPLLVSCLILFLAMFNFDIRRAFFVNFFLTLYVGMQASHVFMADKCVLFAFVSGMITGMLYVFNVFHMQQWTFVTERMINVLSRFPVPDPLSHTRRRGFVLPMGATEAAQREQMLEWSENYSIVQRMMTQHRLDTEASLPPLQINSRWFRSLFGNGTRQPGDVPLDDVSEELVETLVNMGFTNRQRVVEVLRDVDNDLNVAALILSQNFSNAS